MEQRRLLSADLSPQGQETWDELSGGSSLEAAAIAGPPSTFQEAGLLIDYGKAANGIPMLSSNPAAAAKVYLDFDGHFEAAWGSYSNVTTPAWSLDGDLNSFNSTEAAAIRDIWKRVAEDFAPFNLDVTTIEPSSFANREGLRVSIGGSGGWTNQSVTGFAYANTWTNSIVNTVYVFPGRLSNSSKSIAEVSSHEVGHAFGLYHQSTYSSTGAKLQEYNTGSGEWAPIMGNGNSKARTTWHNGPTTSSTNFQNELQIISSAANTFGYRQDDHGARNTPRTLPLDSAGYARAVGIIERMDDVDAFSFQVTYGGIGEFRVDAFELGPNLKTVVQLWNESGQLLVTANPSSTYGAQFTRELAAGNYVVTVQNEGFYGSLGHYTLTVNVDSPKSTAAADDFYQILQDGSSAELFVLENDSASQSGSSLSIVGVSPTANGGTVDVISGNYLRYQPANGFVGQDRFTYTINDDVSGGESTATVWIDVLSTAGRGR
jgi:hypothetical protein